MAVYTTDEQVRSIVDVDEELDIDPFIELANMLIVAKCVPAGYADDELEKLERLLTAHFIQVSYPEMAEETAGRASEKPRSKVDLGLNLTHPGQQVLLLDYKGALAAINMPKRIVKALWLGRSKKDRGYRLYPDDYV